MDAFATDGGMMEATAVEQQKAGVSYYCKKKNQKLESMNINVSKILTFLLNAIHEHIFPPLLKSMVYTLDFFTVE
jgi:hypothetical protein